VDKEAAKGLEVGSNKGGLGKAGRIRRYLALGTALVVLALFAKIIIGEIRSAKPVDVGYVAPNFTLPDLEGREVSLSDYRGKVVFLNIWATWCPPCRDEMPSMQKMYEALKGDRFEILAVSIDAGEARVVRKFMEELKLTFPALHDRNSQVYKLYRATGVPETFIIDHKGIIAARYIGALDWNRRENRKVVEDLIERAKKDSPSS
jgi:peroxiredoxin